MGFTLSLLMPGAGRVAHIRLYAILAYEYAIQALRTSAGVAVAMTVAPFLFLLILVLGRYMMRREDMAHTSADDSVVWRGLMTILWPVRMLLRAVLAIFWAVNGAVETVCGAIGRLIRPPGSASMLRRGSRRKVGVGVLYALIAVLVLFEIFP